MKLLDAITTGHAIHLRCGGIIAQMTKTSGVHCLGCGDARMGLAELQKQTEKQLAQTYAEAP